MTEEVKTKDEGPFGRYLRYDIYGTLVTGVNVGRSGTGKLITMRRW